MRPIRRAHRHCGSWARDGSLYCSLMHGSFSAKGDTDAAENYLHRALYLRPDNYVVLNLLGEFYTNLQQYSEAGIYFDRSLIVDETQPESWEGLANVESMLGRSEMAITYAENALKLDSDRGEAHRIIADAHFEKHRHVEAIKSYKAALLRRASSKGVSRRFFRACVELYGAEGNTIDLQFLRTLIHSADILQVTHMGDADAEKFAAKFTPAFRESDFDPLLLFFHDLTLVRLADSLNQARTEELLESLRIVMERSAQAKMPEHLHYSLGRIFYEFGAYDECQRVFGTMLEQCGPNESSFYYLGACSEIREDFRSAQMYYKKALRFEDCEDTRTGIHRVAAKIKPLKKAAAGAAN